MTTARPAQRVWLRRLADVGIFVCVLIIVNVWQTRNLLSDALPNVTLTTLTGERAPLSALKGKPTLVAAWAPWCGVCKANSQNLSWAQKLVGARANVVSIAFAYDTTASVRAYVDAHDVHYPVLLGDDATMNALRVTSFPTLYFIDADGRVRHRAAGYTTLFGILVRLFL